MNTNHVTAAVKVVQKTALSVFLVFGFIAGSYAACCSGHGGVASCNKVTGFKMCKDGTASPTCSCPKSKKATKAKAIKETKAVKEKKAAKGTDMVVPSSTTNPKTSPKATITKNPKATKAAETKGSWWGGMKKTTTAPVTGGAVESVKGCCSHHGGVARCDTKTGRQLCKDGTNSASCLCH